MARSSTTLAVLAALGMAPDTVRLPPPSNPPPKRRSKGVRARRRKQKAAKQARKRNR